MAPPGCCEVAPATENQSAIYRCAASKKGFPELGVATLYEAFDRSSKKFADLPALGHRPIGPVRGGWQRFQAVPSRLRAPRGALDRRECLHSSIPVPWTPQDGSVGDFQWLTYSETAERVARIASALAGLGLIAKDRVGVYGANCPEWMIAMQVGAGRCMRPHGAAGPPACAPCNAQCGAPPRAAGQRGGAGGPPPAG
jgi:non-ribosomal peptide synthetase component F